MTPAFFHETALALPGVTFDVKWGNDGVFSVGKMFAVYGPIDSADARYSFKASDIAFEMLIEQGLAIPAPYMARAKWVQLAHADALCDAEVAAYLREGHALVAAKLTRKVRAELGLEA